VLKSGALHLGDEIVEGTLHPGRAKLGRRVARLDRGWSGRPCRAARGRWGASSMPCAERSRSSRTTGRSRNRATSPSRRYDAAMRTLSSTVGGQAEACRTANGFAVAEPLGCAVPMPRSATERQFSKLDGPWCASCERSRLFRKPQVWGSNPQDGSSFEAKIGFPGECGLGVGTREARLCCPTATPAEQGRVRLARGDKRGEGDGLAVGHVAPQCRDH
jgi:hypothetical protein